MSGIGPPRELDVVDHVAVHVDDLVAAVGWYTRQFECVVEYQDDTWALLGFANVHVALVTSGQHPPHVAIARPDAHLWGDLVTHRDGTRSTYVQDPAGNDVEVIERA